MQGYVERSNLQHVLVLVLVALGRRPAQIIARMKRNEPVATWTPPAPPRPDVDPAKVTQAALRLDGDLFAIAAAERAKRLASLTTCLENVDRGKGLSFTRPEHIDRWRTEFRVFRRICG